MRLAQGLCCSLEECLRYIKNLLMTSVDTDQTVPVVCYGCRRTFIIKTYVFAFISGSSVSQTPKFKVDYNLLLENIKDLNTLAGEGVASVKRTKDGARLKVSLISEHSQLTFVLLNLDIPAFANSVDPDQLASPEAN